MTEKDKEKSTARQVFEASTVGIHLVLCTIVGGAIGYGLDQLFGTGYLKFVFLVMGIIAGFMELFKIARKGERDEHGPSDDSKNH